MRRPQSQATSRAGVNYVGAIVEEHNCTFTEIPGHSDLGIDAIVEFIEEERSTGCCIGLQIKSGRSYYNPSTNRFRVHSDRAHFGYWNSYLMPVGAVGYDPETQRSAWMDVTNHLEERPGAINDGPFTLSPDRPFTSESFPEFRQWFMQYRDSYKDDSRFGRALEQFANTSDVESCLLGLRTLFSFHRDKSATWYYIINSFRNFSEHDMLRDLVYVLTHIPGHGDIFWGARNRIDAEIRVHALGVMRAVFGRDEATALARSIDEDGLQRGTIGQSAHAIINEIRGKEGLLEAIAFDARLDEETRFNALMLLIYYTQESNDGGARRSIELIDRFVTDLPEGAYASTFLEARRILREFGYISFY
jgi:hypothetical protein